MRHRRTPPRSMPHKALAASAGFALLMGGAGAAWAIKQSDPPAEMELRMRGDASASRTAAPRAAEAPTRTPSVEPRPPRPKASPTKKERRPAKTARPKRTSRPSPPAPPEVSRQREAENAAVRLTNKAREKEGCAPLRNDDRLRTASRKHSVDMAKKNYFSHNSQDGTSPWDRMKAQGYRWPGAENIAKGHRSAEAVVDGWMKSTGHRANILNCSLKAIGVGVSFAGNGPLWTQDFGYR